MKKIILLILISLLFSPLKSQVWEKADGPFEYTSAFSIFSFNNDLYFYGSKGGVYKENTKNNDWLKQETGFFSDKGTVFYFEQKENVAITTTKEGVYWTYDYGVTWNNFDNDSKDLVDFPFFTIVDQTIFLQSFNSSLYKLEKGSKTIEKIYSDEDKTDSIFADVLVTKDNYIFAADSRQSSDHQPVYGKLYISKDKGETWTLSKTMRKYIENLLFHDNILFAFTKDRALYKSTDYGETWTTDTNIQIDAKKVVSYKDLIFACSSQVLVSSDDGNSWSPLNNGLDYYGCNDIITKGESLYYLTSKNLIYTFDYAKKYWNRISPMTDDIRQLKIKDVRDTLFSSGMFTLHYSVDNGASWQMYSDSLYYHYSIWSDVYIQDSIFVVLDQRYTYMLISSDYGKSWRFENLGIFSLDSWISCVIIMGNRILVSSYIYGNFISNDAGLTWESYDNNVLKNDIGIFTYLRFNNTKIILYSKDGLYKTDDNGLTWKFEKIEGETRVNPYSYIDGLNIYNIDFNNNQILKSSDLGRTWADLELNIEPNLIWISLTAYNGYLILFTTTDVYISSNEGKGWKKYEVDLLIPNGKKLYFYSGVVSNDYLVLTSSNGIWRAKLSDLGIVKSSVESETERNYLYTYPPYPLPAKSEVKVLFYWDINIPMTVDDISIYDLSGQKIEAKNNLKLIKQESHYGNIIWDCSTTPAGIYLINIKHGTESKSVKVVVE